MSNNNSQRAVFAPEQTAIMNGTWLTIATMTYNPVIIIFDNQSAAASIAISIDGGTTTWRTFPAGEAVLLDLGANIRIASNYTIDQGTVFSGNGASGVFSISYLYART